MENSTKVYCGKGKTFGQYNKLSLNLCVDDFMTHIQIGANGKRYIRLVASTMKNVDKYGNTHTVEVDTWKKPEQPAPEAEGVTVIPF